MKRSLFYHKRPVFGLDIGSQRIKVMQLERHKNKARVLGYGSAQTDEKLIKNGVINQVAAAAKLVDELLATQLKGKLSTNAVVMSIPIAHVFTRVLSLPQMSKKELIAAVELEIEQSVPLAPKDLYFDFETSSAEDDGQVLVRMVAAPRNIVDSYVAVCDLLKLELALIQTNIEADARLCMLYEDINDGSPYIIIDVGGNSIDVGILDSTLRVTGTVDIGGEDLTKSIAAALHVSSQKAQAIKVSQGLNAGKQQAKIKQAVEPQLEKVAAEIKRIKKFYQERIQQGVDISQIVITGGGANMPGLGDYLTNSTRIPTRVSSPWVNHISFGKLKPPDEADLPRFLTAAGLALADDKEASL